MTDEEALEKYDPRANCPRERLNALHRVANDFDFLVPVETLAAKCRAKVGTEQYDRLLWLYAMAYKIGRPKALAVEAAVEEVDAKTVRVGGVEIASSFVREKLLQSPVAYAYLLTCGQEVEEWSRTLTDIVDVFYVDELKKLWLGCAENAVRAEVRKRLAPEAPLSSLNPGSLPQWPIEGQRELFRILCDTEGTVGVCLTDSCLMLPPKSISGILFQDHTGHVNCALCPRENCPNRRVPFRMNVK